MADKNEKETKEDGKTPEAGPKKGRVLGIVGIVLPAVLAGAGAFGGAFFGGSSPPAAEATEAEPQDDTPGPTVPLTPFVLNVQDKDGNTHAAKVSFALELAHGTDHKAFEVFVPRIRDTCLTYLRSMPFEDISDNKRQVKMTEDLLASIQKLGADAVTRVLVQDFVVQ